LFHGTIRREKRREQVGFIMKQQSFTDMEYGGRRRVSKREDFLDIMEEIIPWDEWVSLVEPHFYCGKRLNPQPGDNNSERAGSDTSTSSYPGRRPFSIWRQRISRAGETI